MRKNIQNCAKCGTPLTDGCRMEMMMGPKGYRSYAVCMGICGRRKTGDQRPGTIRSARAQGSRQSRKGMIKAGA